MEVKTKKEALGSVLDSLTVEGQLYEVVDAEQKKIRCYACAHRCLIKEGRRGICNVRYNEGGILRVPHGYVGALQLDPIEKKPFFHVLPGTDALSFGMLGCDFRCSYCFTPETMIATEHSPQAIGDLFQLGECIDLPDGASIAFPDGLRVFTGSGQLRTAVKVFRHPYKGSMTVIKPYYLPQIVCTPDHRVYATDDHSKPPEKIEAQNLTLDHYLAVPCNYTKGRLQDIDVYSLLSTYTPTHRRPHRLKTGIVEYVLSASMERTTSQELGKELGKDPSYIRHIRSKVRRGLWTDDKPIELILENSYVRFTNERHPYLPTHLKLDKRFAHLLGLYCAEGSVLKNKTRPNSYALTFSFSLHEEALAVETVDLIESVFGVRASIIHRATTLAVSTGKTSLALLFMGLCGTGSTKKFLPQVLFDAPDNVIAAFLNAYVLGDGHRTQQGKVSLTTKSKALAYGVSWLALKSGHLASVYTNDVGSERLIQGRQVQQSPTQYSVVWYETGSNIKRKFVCTDDFYLIPLRSLSTTEFDGYVYNLEVEGEHNYLVNFMLVSNCQNWLTSQTLRDDAAGVMPEIISADGLVNLTKRYRAKSLASTYNEPLITSEWAVDVFKPARQAGLKTLYISNGNATKEALEFLVPWVDAYKIDLKTMNDAHYRKYLGGVLQHVLDTIKMAHEMGLWVEIVTLVIPGFNDSNEELWDAARYIRSVSPDIPWHVTAFHPDYKMSDVPRTTINTLMRAAEIGAEAGLNYIYAGNLPGQMQSWEDTRCPTCQTTVIRRWGFKVLENKLGADGTCPSCHTKLPGQWT